MEETKIWAVEGTSATPLNTTNQMESEGLLESVLTANPDMLEEGMQLVGRQTSTAGGRLDLLGVDSDSRLVVFELKRGVVKRGAVEQAIDYASYLNSMGLDSLTEHITKQSSNHEDIQEISDFVEWYSNNFSDKDIESLLPPRMVLVGLGVDDTTKRMVNFIASSEMDISLLTFYGFVNIDGKTLLTRDLEVGRADAVVRASRKSSSRDRRSQFVERAQELTRGKQMLLDEFIDECVEITKEWDDIAIFSDIQTALRAHWREVGSETKMPSSKRVSQRLKSLGAVPGRSAGRRVMQKMLLK